MLSSVFLASISSAAQLAEWAVPLAPSPQPATAEIEAYRPVLDALGGLVGRDRVRLSGVPLADGGTVRVNLRSIRLDRLELGLRVDGQPAPDVLAGLDLSLWRGTVDGDPGSDVALSFSNHGVRGWVRAGGTLTHLLPVPAEGGDWSRSTTWILSEEELAEFGFESDFACHADDATQAAGRTPRNATEPARHGSPPLVPKDVSTSADSPCLLRTCSIALETDFEHNQLFGGSVPAQVAYTTSLLGAISDLYESELGVLLTFPYLQLYTTPADPWSTPETGFAVLDYLFEVKAAWEGAIPGGARLGHLLSGAFLDGGVAFIDVLCEESGAYPFGVTANHDGSTSFPVAVGPFNWDFTATSHEIGHSFGAHHTFAWQPIIDDCPSVCSSSGTLMSYCHLCPGGISNIQLAFHPLVREYLLDEIVHCLPLASGVVVEPPLAWDPSASTPIVARVGGTPVGPVELSWRFAPADPFQQLAMTDLGGGLWSADLPPAPCGTAPEFFVGYTDTGCGAASSPVFTPPVAHVEVVFEDDFETDKGWTGGLATDTASAGLWVRAAPVGSYAEAYEDHSKAGTLAWITEPHAGGEAFASDVDGGVTTLVSPLIDLSAGDAIVRYERWYHNIAAIAPGLDSFQVDITDDGGQSWVAVETVGPFGEQATGGWHPHQFLVSDFVAPTAQVQVRFVAKDSFDTTVEAGLDDFLVYRANCTVCQQDLGFQGPGDLSLNLCGDPLAPGGSADLVLAGADPGAPVWLVGSLVTNPIPIFGGTLVTVPNVLLIVGNADAAGNFELPGLTSTVAVPLTLYLQGLAVDLALPELIEISNALAAQYLP
ncbi:M12 family metallo-peptidase [Engelhardtia mirabilis]|uniref:MAM domain-containing protein n=1 Tax=Engelhardtia mirabilis TaxID=2528011 RepID=A0A518BRL1_9BACT|nr:hypothetical protein Pla133_47320 [Planctomycetes bacterium Pla133]QDV03938.1 hypothetical protein Pla86_47300 [Planctomycetes bacterium Pla86]